MSSTNKEFSGSGKVHGSSLTMVDWRRADYERITKRLNGLAKKMTIRKAINRAAKRAADTGVTATKRGIARDTTLKTSEIGKKVKTYVYGSPLAMSIGMKISDTARPLSDFAFLPKKPKPKTVPIVEVHKGQKMKLEKGAFVAQMPTGHIGIFERTTDKSMPIRSMPGPSVTGLFKANERTHQMVWDIIFETFEKRVEHELERLLNGNN